MSTTTPLAAPSHSRSTTPGAGDPVHPAGLPSIWRKEWKALALIIGAFLLCFYLPLGLVDAAGRAAAPVGEALHLVRWYAREHVILCLVPAFFIAGAIGVFVSQGSVMRYLGADANKMLAYGVASVAGTLLAVCSCTVLPLFAGIYAMGAGLGPASAFLYSGPAINVLAIIFTARVLGLELGIARALGAILFAVVIGLAMQLVFRREEAERAEHVGQTAAVDDGRPLWQSAAFLAALVGVLVFANWGEPASSTGVWHAIYGSKWLITSMTAAAMAVILVVWFGVSALSVAIAAGATAFAALVVPGAPLVAFGVAIVGLSIITSTGSAEPREWFASSWGFAKQILPLLLIGVLAAGALLGRPGHEGLIPSDWVAVAVGGNSLLANTFASVIGAFMYFATLTEVPILQGLIGSGMGGGPALALLLAGPALSLPSILVIRSVIGMKKTLVYVGLVAVISTIAGLLYGVIAA